MLRLKPPRGGQPESWPLNPWGGRKRFRHRVRDGLEWHLALISQMDAVSCPSAIRSHLQREELMSKLCPAARARSLPAVAERPFGDLLSRYAAPPTLSGIRWLTLGLLVGAAPTLTAAEPVRFNRDIRPFLSDTCFHCHGPDGAAREAGLRLDQQAEATADRGGYAAIVPGDADASEAVLRVLSEDPDYVMPPAESDLKLTSEQKELFRRWVAEGAVYEQHWSFVPIKRPDVPAEFAGEHPIDAFVGARLAEAGLQPSPAAQHETLIRRATLDLTGLPPTREEVDAFLADVEQRGIDVAYEAVLDRLLASPRYGEHMAWQWLEAARYADTDGYQNDGPRTMWRWRDWVIDAYNSNMPFDQFTIEQLAGDLLPNPTRQQLIATAFNRNGRYNSEEGIPIDEFLLENAVDRVDTTATVWMGLTVGCARCHDHKFDPISQAEYYQLIDYFNDVAESGRAIKFGNSEPWIRTPTREQQQRLKQFNKRVAAARQKLAAAESEIEAAQRDWEHELTLADPVLSYGLDHHFAFDTDDPRVKPGEGEPAFGDGVFGRAAVLNGNDSFQIGEIDGLIGNGRFSAAFWMKPQQVDRGPVLSNEEAGTRRAGVLLEFVNGHLRWNINHRWISGVSTIETERTFEPSQWVHVVLTNDGTQRAAGMRIYIDGQRQDVRVIRNTNSNTAKRAQGAAMSIGHSRHVGFWQGQIDELRFYTHRTLSPDEVELLAVRETPAALAAIPVDQRSTAQADLLRLAFLEQGADEGHARLLTELREAEAARRKYVDSLPTTMVMRDLPEGRLSYVRTRGTYDQLGQQVQPDVPAVLPPLPAGPNNRLSFARWLVSRQHPLTARVAVNRYWQMLFGRGLVQTTEDWGSQGSPPSHPELLDWLAARFMDSGWDVQEILKTIMMSHTYRQSSLVEPEHLEKDPQNVLLARAPRLRLRGNVLRDQALFVSELLVEQLGGPSVYPYQPDRLWEEASNFKYTVGKGPDLYRRSLYTYWKRTLAPPEMAVLDTADREYCSVRPKSTNTPLQALTLMNDVTFVEAARKLGERMLREAGSSDAERIQYAFRTVAARSPTPSELDLLGAALDGYRREFHENSSAAEAVLGVGESATGDQHPPAELAAATALANVLLNLDEVTTRE